MDDKGLSSPISGPRVSSTDLEFAPDSLLEGDGFELLVPRYEGASRDMGLAQVSMSCKRRVAAIDLSGIASSPGLLETKTVCLSLAERWLLKRKTRPDRMRVKLREAQETKCLRFAEPTLHAACL